MPKQTAGVTSMENDDLHAMNAETKFREYLKTLLIGAQRDRKGDMEEHVQAILDTNDWAEAEQLYRSLAVHHPELEAHFPEHHRTQRWVRLIREDGQEGTHILRPGKGPLPETHRESPALTNDKDDGFAVEAPTYRLRPDSAEREIPIYDEI
jgi:hypothetical protein